MNSDRQTRATEILRDSSSQEANQRRSYAIAACGNDGELRELVETLLDQPRSPEPATGTETQVLDTHAVTGPAAPAGGGGSREPGIAAGASTVRKKVESGDLVGHQIGPYELLRRIGKGGMGTVYAARRVDQEFRKLVAIKFVKPGMETEEIIQRFRQERQVLAGLDHPNIARLLDGGSDRGIPYLVMEYVEGTPIDQYCRNHRLTVSERLHLFCTVCSAVQYAHQSLVVHRDIKPTNILVTADGTPKLLDFGIAKVLSPEFADTRALTLAEERPMTPDFASPEQVRGEPVTTSSDVYALGILLFELLTGGHHPLRPVYSKLGFERAVLEAEPERLSTAAGRLTPESADIPEGDIDRLRSRLRGDLDSIVHMALRKEPQRRYASVQHFADDIQRFLQGSPVRAHKDTVGYRARKFVKRHAAGVFAAAVAAIALIASSVISYSYYRVAMAEKVKADERFTDVRKLARFVLFELDEVLRQGVTPARKAVVEKATEYLQRLEEDRGDDPSLEQELVQGYLKMGNLQGNLDHANVGDAAAAKASYDRAMKIVDSARSTDPKLLAQTRMHLADLLWQTGSIQDAIAAFQKSRDVLRGYHDDGARRSLLALLRKLAGAHSQLGDYDSALAAYDEFTALAKEMDRASPTSEFKGMVASGELRRGEIRARRGEPNGLAQMENALKVSDEIAAAAPFSPAAQAPVATASGLIGDVLVLGKRYREAAPYFRRSLEVTEALAAADPKNGQFQVSLYTFLGRLADAYANSGNLAEARKLTQKQLEVLEPLANRENATEWDMWQYAWTLLTTPFDDLRNPALAKVYATKMLEMSKGQNPSALDLMARAHAGMRDFRRAEEMELKALALLPAGKQSAMRREFEQNLAAFRSGRPMP